ncbi:MAG: NAD(P)-dependent oxidoreductase [Ignavibacteriales bacterium CG12_big_fil_rev_8_21_14_0_65_30_8]|nr:MAG: NAD(P)-dependent oxidoreductase [Ignavibacteriales bacterium CG12_big_fil_rev_8_21_14_0_65_30_8]
MRLKNKTVFITGASAGIGKACAIAFAKEGANLILSARRMDKLNELTEDIKKKFEVKVFAFELDVRNLYKVKQSISSLPSEWNKIDILINNAGLAKGFSKINDGNIEDWEEMIDTNLKGLLYVTRYVLPFMIKQNEGHVINLGSIAGHQVYPYGNVYCATKFAVNSLSEAIRMDTLEHNIRVTNIAPGLVETEFSEVRFKGDKERAKNVYKGITPLDGDDIADLVLFAATRKSHVNINEIIVTPTAQASATQVHRKDS